MNNRFALVGDMPLPITCEINRLAALHCQPRNLLHLIAVRHAAVILAPRRLLRIAEQVIAADMVMMTNLSAAHAAEKFLCPIRASAVE